MARYFGPVLVIALALYEIVVAALGYPVMRAGSILWFIVAAISQVTILFLIQRWRVP